VVGKKARRNDPLHGKAWVKPKGERGRRRGKEIRIKEEEWRVNYTPLASPDGSHSKLKTAQGSR